MAAVGFCVLMSRGYCMYQTKCHAHLPFLDLFSSGDQLRGSFSLSKLHLHRTVQQAEGCCHQTVMQSWGYLHTLNQIDRLFAHQFHRLYFLHVALNASIMKLVALSGRSLTVTLGELRSDPENTAVYLCVLSYPCNHTTQHRKNRCSLAFYGRLSRERGEPPAGGALLPVHHDLDSL